MIFKSKDIDNIYVPDDEYFKQYSIKLAKESVAKVVEKSTANNITPTNIIN